MGFFDRVMGSKEDVDVDEFLNNMDVSEETQPDDADAYVKPMVLSVPEDVDLVVNEMRMGNIVLLNIGDLSKRNAIKLKEYVGRIKQYVMELDGDIARISADRVLITPSKVKIMKRQ